MAVALLALGAASAAQAASAPTLQGRIVLRPVSPSDKGDYGLASSTETSGGLTTIGVGTPAYIEAEVAISIPASNTVVTWTLTKKPVSSAAVLANSPLGTNVPVYSVVDRANFRVVGSRVLLRPDVEGQYTFTATITNSTYGGTNLTQTITAASYLGYYYACQACHSGGGFAPDKSSWTNTEHASMFTRGISGDPSVAGYGANCISCHTVGYDVNTNAVNGGFDDVATATGWKFPSMLTPTNWANIQANYPDLANVANIQCENCHGPGSEHIVFGGHVGNTNTISVSWDAGNCGQCHDSKSHHVKVPQWENSLHGQEVLTTSASCSRCHTAQGFVNFLKGAPAVSTASMPVTCAACHDPHVVGTNNPHQLRTVGPVALNDNTTIVTNGGLGQICMNCHQSHQNATNYVATTAGTSRYSSAPMGPQTDMFEGVNAITYGMTIPNSAHRNIADTCVTCHMQITTNASAYLLAGDHTFNMSFTSTNGVKVAVVDACQQCHGPINSFDLPRGDFDGDGVVNGAQTEVKGLLTQLSLLLPPIGVAKTNLSLGAPALVVDSTWTSQQLKAAFNYAFVVDDRSFGVHNLPFTVGLLKASIADLLGDATVQGPMSASDLAYYNWQVQNFGSGSNPNAARNASPAGDGVPNWLKFNLGLNPNVAGIAVTNGVVWVDGSSLNGSVNTIQIYTAAEVVFNTVIGHNYQIQSISALDQTWMNVGAPITGTGSSISYVTPTRNDPQQFFRVVPSP